MAEKEKKSSGFFAKLGQRIGNLFRGKGFKTDEQLAPPAQTAANTDLDIHIDSQIDTQVHTPKVVSYTGSTATDIDFAPMKGMELDNPIFDQSALTDGIADDDIYEDNPDFGEYIPLYDAQGRSDLELSALAREQEASGFGQDVSTLEAEQAPTGEQLEAGAPAQVETNVESEAVAM